MGARDAGGIGIKEMGVRIHHIVKRHCHGQPITAANANIASYRSNRPFHGALSPVSCFQCSLSLFFQQTKQRYNNITCLGQHPITLLTFFSSL